MYICKSDCIQILCMFSQWTQMYIYICIYRYIYIYIHLYIYTYLFHIHTNIISQNLENTSRQRISKPPTPRTLCTCAADVCVCVCIHRRLHIHIHNIYIYVYIHIYVHIYIYTYIYIYIHTQEDASCRNSAARLHRGLRILLRPCSGESLILEAGTTRLPSHGSARPAKSLTMHSTHKKCWEEPQPPLRPCAVDLAKGPWHRCHPGTGTS